MVRTADRPFAPAREQAHSGVGSNELAFRRDPDAEAGTGGVADRVGGRTLLERPDGRVGSFILIGAVSRLLFAVLTFLRIACFAMARRETAEEGQQMQVSLLLQALPCCILFQTVSRGLIARQKFILLR